MDVALIGLILPNVQNHSLARLAGAAKGAGFKSVVVPFRGFPDIAAVVATVINAGVRLCGVSIQTGEAALASVTLIEMLRLGGYGGAIVVGGHFATLNAEDLLREVPSIDVVVRFAGEPALLALLRDGTGDGALDQIPGAVFRHKTGALRHGAPPIFDVPVPDQTAGDQDLPVHLGFAAADIVGSRGCEAHCSYCCVAGSGDLAERAGGARYRRDSTDALGDQIARLYHEHDARAFNLMDDNLLPMQTDAATAWISEVSAALRARDVGRIAFSLQLRADICTPEVVSGLVNLGLVRAYVGIDGYSGRQLVALGRDAPSSAGPRALDLLNAAGVFTVCNALILGPTFGFASLRAEIEALGDVQHAPVHLLPIDVRKGSRYFERAAGRGLLEGGMLLRRYRFEDPRTALLAEAVTGFPTRLEEYSVPIALYDLGYNLGIARRLVPEANVDEARETYGDVTRRWNTDQLRVLREAADAAASLDRERVMAFVAAERDRVRALDDQLRAACAAALHALERAVSRAVSRARGVPVREVRAHRRGLLLSGVALSMMLASCEHRSSISVGGQAGDGQASAAGDAGDGQATDGAAVDVPRIVIGDAAPGSGFNVDALSLVCGDGGRTPVSSGVTSSACCLLGVTGAQITFNDAGIPIAITLPDGGTVSDASVACVLSALSTYCYPSLAGTTQPLVNAHCWIA